MRVVVSNKNNIGRVTFGKVVNVGNLGSIPSLSSIGDVVTTGQQDGDTLVYQANTNNYVMKAVPDVDGGLF